MCIVGVRSCMLHGSETLPVKKEHELALLGAEMRIVRLMCGVKLFHKVACFQWRERLLLESFFRGYCGWVLQCNR